MCTPVPSYACIAQLCPPYAAMTSPLPPSLTLNVQVGHPVVGVCLAQLLRLLVSAAEWLPGALPSACTCLRCKRPWAGLHRMHLPHMTARAPAPAPLRPPQPHDRSC